MSKLTHERVNGIKTGYWSMSKKDELVQRLGQIEARSAGLIGQICDRCCRFPSELKQDELDKICETCPANFLYKLVDGDYPGFV